MHDRIRRTSYFNRYGLHQSIASCSTIPRINVDMLAPQTAWAVVCIPVTGDMRAAMIAREVFNTALEKFVGGHAGEYAARTEEKSTKRSRRDRRWPIVIAVLTTKNTKNTKERDGPMPFVFFVFFVVKAP